GHAVHLFRANLHFELHAAFGHDRGMQRLIQVRPRHRDEVLDAPRHRPPDAMDSAQRGIAVVYRFGDDADGEQVIDLVYRDALPLQFLMNAVEPLDAMVDAGFDGILFELFLYEFDRLLQEGIALFTPRVHLLFDLLVPNRVDVLKCEVFEFAANFSHSETMGERCEDIERLLSDMLLALRRQVLESSHVVQAV